MIYSDEIIEELRSRNNIVDVISEYVKLTRKGTSYKGLCPFHSEKTPSFSVSPAWQTYHCFGCGASGDVFSFLMEYDSKTFQEAVETLAARSGLELPKRNEDEKSRRETSLKKRLLEIHREAAVWYYKELYQPAGKQALSYLKGRGLSDDVIRAFGLGYSGRGNNALYAYLKKKGFSDAELKASGLFTVVEGKDEIREKFWNRVMFPIMDVNRKVIGFGGRVMGDAKPKYLNSPETLLFDKSSNLYALHAAKMARKKQLLLCEGYMDVISLHRFGFTNSVATLGTALTSKQGSILHRYADEVLLMYDSDEAGVKAALRAIPILRHSGITPKVVNLEPYKDPDELLKAEGEAFLAKRIAEAENGFLFEIRQAYGNYDKNDPAGVSGFQHEAARMLAGFPDEIERESYLKTVAARYHIDEKMLRRQIGRLSMTGTPQPAEETQPRKRPSGKNTDTERHRAEEAVLSWVFRKPELAAFARKNLDPEDFSPGVHRILAEKLLAAGTAEGTSTVSALNGFEDGEERAKAAAILESNLLPEREEEQKKALLEAAVQIRMRQIEEALSGTGEEDMETLSGIMEHKKKLEQLKKQLSGG